MDPRNRADETLARARARGAFVVTPDNAISPMDASTTVRIPRSIVADSERDTRDPESTMVLSQSAPQDELIGGWPQNDYGQNDYGHQDYGHHNYPANDYGQANGYGQASGYLEMPPNPYQQQRRPGEFGPLGSRATPQFPPY
jgi:hypothetical protein